jgi:hypothetical protein
MRDGWRRSRNQNVDAFAPEVGPEIARRRTTAAGETIEVAFEFTVGELAIFDAFYEVTLKSGTRRFEWVHPVTGAVRTWAFIAASPPEDEPVGADRFRVSFPLFLYT